MKKSPFELFTTRSDTTFSIRIAETIKDIDACLELRGQFFSPLNQTHLKDEDEFDKHCCHLMVNDLTTKQVVGTYRLLRHDVATKNRGFYSETEFDLTNIKQQNLQLVELGRFCTAKEYRTKHVVAMLWTGIYEYLDHYQLDYLAGCVSLPADQKNLSSMVYAYAKQANQLVEPAFQVYPLPCCVDKTFDPNFEITDTSSLKQALPSLLNIYFSFQSKICGPSSFDSVLNVNDFFILSCLKNRNSNPNIRQYKHRV